MNALRQAYGWRRPGIGAATPVLVLIAALLVPLVTIFAVDTALVVAGAARRLDERPVRALADPTPGPRLTHALVEGESRPTPSGTLATAFEAILTQSYETGSGKNRTTHTEVVCKERHVGWTALRDGATTVPLPLGTSIDLRSPSQEQRPRSGSVRVLASEAVAGAPPSGWATGRGCWPRSDAKLSYTEIVVAPGTPVTVSACRTAAGLVPCGDDLDALVAVCGRKPCASAPRARAALIANWLGEARLVAGLAAVLSGAIVAAFAVVQLVRHGRERRARHADVR